MRCPECGTTNEEGEAVCAMCAAPLTAYGGQVTGEVSEATLRKLAQLDVRPAVVVPVTLWLALLAIAGPMAGVLLRYAGRTTVNPEGTNYVGAAVGAVGIALTAAVLVPLAIVLLLTAWGVWAQRPWAWWAALAAMVVFGLAALLGVWPNALVMRLVVLASCAAVAWSWTRPDTKHWYGIR